MTKRTVLAVTAAGCACATAAVVVGAHGATGPAQVRITDTQTLRSVATPRNGGAAGTVEVIAQRLYNQRISQKALGRSQLVCTYVDRRNRTCVSTYILPRGTLVAAGAVQNRLLYELPVIGGTGLYDNARGTLTVTATHLKPRREVLVFRLLG
jgi:hypothetical protein